MNFASLPVKDRQEIIRRVQADNGLHRQIIEKDWWVTAVLRALFSLPYAGHISFKGGTNLSKCWHLINRMSEDADIAIDREFLGFSGTLSKTQISDKLRRASCSFVREKLQYDLAEQLVKNGIDRDTFAVSVNITPITTTDPEIIEVAYHPAFEDTAYMRSKVIVEVSGRSMSEPVTPVPLRSFIDDVFTQAPFTESDFEVRAVVPQRTFLYWHNGYGTEAACACLEYAFGELALKTVCCSIRPENKASIRVVERLGMTLCGSHTVIYNEKEMPHLIYELKAGN